jgi:hypothetical protein
LKKQLSISLWYVKMPRLRIEKWPWKNAMRLIAEVTDDSSLFYVVAKHTKQIITTSGQISLDHQGELLPDDSVSQTSTSRRKRKPVIMVQEEKEEQPAEVKANNPATVAKKSDKNKQDPSSSSGLDQLYAAINVNNAPAYSIPRVDSASTGNRQVSSSIPTIPSLTNGMVTARGESNKNHTGGNDVHSPVSLDGQGFKPPAQYVADSDLYLAAWLLKTNIPLECLECAEFRQFITSCSGGTYQLPTQHELQQIALVLLRQQQQQQQQQQFQHGQLQMMHTNQPNTRHFPCPSQQQQQPQQIQRQEQMLQSNNPKRW